MNHHYKSKVNPEIDTVKSFNITEHLPYAKDCVNAGKYENIQRINDLSI